MPSPANLPQQLNSFVGRQAEVDEVRRLLATNRLLTLVGPGGCGKTRLALRVATELSDAFPDGVRLVELEALADPALVPQAVAMAINAQETPSRSLTDTLAATLATRNLLLVLDNCEHLIDACARLAQDLLRACPQVRILATSREVLNVTGEVSWPVPPLSIPDAQHLPSDSDSPAVLMRYESVRLFCERAAAVLPGFALSPDNASAVARVCQRADGMPLALELAAARVRSLSVAQIAGLLGDSFSLLTTGARTALPRQQTLKATIDWSYDLLSGKEQALFRRLAVFAGSFTLDAVEAICAAAPIEQAEALDLLSSLVSKSLVVAQAHSVVARYKLLETVWQYARQKLQEAGEVSTLGRLHQDWYLALAEQAEPELRRAGQFAWLSRLDEEMANLRVAMQWSAAEGDNSEALLRLAGSLWWFWALRSYLSEGRRRLREALEQGAGTSTAPLYGKALTAAGALAWLQSDLEEARSILEKSVACWRELGDEHGLAYALMFLGEVTLYQGSPAPACAIDDESVALLRQTGDTWGLALALACLAEASGIAGDYDVARSAISESLALFRETGDSWGIALSTSQFGWLAFRRGDYATARLLFEEGLPIWRRFGDKWHITSTLGYLAQIAQAEDDYRQAVPMYGEQLPLFRELGQMRGLATGLARLAAIAHAQGQVRTSALLLAAADATGAPVISGYAAQFESQVAIARASLGDDFAAVWAEGRALSTARIDSEVERIASVAPRDAGTMAVQPPPARSTGYPGGLTAREVEVLRLVAEGLTDAQAAERLVVSTRTVNSHLRSIYSKLGISSRSAAGRFAAEHGLI